MVLIAFKTLNEQEFNSISNSFSPTISGQGQGDINIFRRYRPNRLTRGQGLLSILSQVGKRALPFIKDWILPSAREYGRNVLSDVIGGKTLKSSLKSRGKESLQNLGQRIVRGQGSKKKKTLFRKKRRALKRLRRTANKGGKKSKKKAKKILKKKKKSYGGSRKRRARKIGQPGRKNIKVKKFARSRRSLMGKVSCSRKKTSSCPKDIFS